MENEVMVVRPQSFETRAPALMKAAEQFARSQIVPVAFRNKPADTFVALEMGAELGVQPMASLNNIYVVQGRPTLSAQLMSAVAKAHPSYRGMEIESSATKAKVTIRRQFNGGVVETQVGEFTLEQAKTAGLATKENWRMYPQNMLEARATAFACRKAFPDLFAGIYTKEEVETMDPAGFASAAIPDEPAVEAAPEPAAAEPSAAPDETVKNRIKEAKARLDAALSTQVDGEDVFFAAEGVKAHDAIHAVPDKGPKGIAITLANAEYLEKLAQEWELKLAAKMEALSLMPSKASQLAAFQDDPLPEAEPPKKSTLSAAIDKLSAQAKGAQTVQAEIF